VPAIVWATEGDASHGLIIPLIIQTIRRDPTGSDQIDAEHQATDLAVGGSNPSRRATITAVQRPITRASGTRQVVLARVARNKRLADACYL
jgi:hypothetical protein